VFAATLALAAFAVPTLAAAQALPSADGGYEMEVSAGKSQVLELPSAYTDLMVADPKVADVLPLNGHSVYVVGKSVGATALTIYGPNRRLIAAVNVVVGADIQSLKTRLAEVLPDEKDISIRMANQSIILSGTVSSPAALGQVMQLAGTYVPTADKIVNMLGVEGSQQVMLSVRFVELSRDAEKGLGVSIKKPDPTANHPGNPPFQAISGSALTNAFSILSARFGAGSNTLNVQLDAMEDKGLVKTLAEPTLVANSGDTANFLAGGEFPVPIAQAGTLGGGGATVTVEFKEFGVGLAFTPTILRDGLINLVVAPEVSSIDPTNAITIPGSGQPIPGLRVRRARTTVELRDGESFTIAGLLQDDYQNTVSQFPFVGDVPVLGALFRSTHYQRNETELVVVVTPHIVVPRKGYVATPADHFVPPSDFETFLFGAQQGSVANLRPEDRALLATDPTKGGVDGAHGHVLY
jgi:pilus assembly protein CpaC